MRVCVCVCVRVCACARALIDSVFISSLSGSLHYSHCLSALIVLFIIHFSPSIPPFLLPSPHQLSFYTLPILPSSFTSSLHLSSDSSHLFYWYSSPSLSPPHLLSQVKSLLAPLLHLSRFHSFLLIFPFSLSSLLSFISSTNVR